MKNDLISRSALLKYLNNGAINFSIQMGESCVATTRKIVACMFEQVEKAINEQPTAYDVDKVVEQLEDAKTNFEHMGTLQSAYYDIGLDKAIAIVRNGGKE